VTVTTSPPKSQLFIDGQFVDAVDGGTFQTANPATSEAIAEVAEAKEADVDQAVRAAVGALHGPWGAMELADRARLIRRVGELLDERAEELGRLEAIDGGKPIREAVPQVRMTAAWFEFFADIAQKLRSAVIPTYTGYFNYTLREPIGVVGIIIPWNYPLPLCGLKIPAALAMGNVVVVKPAEQAPLTTLALADLCREAGFPDGVVNVIPGLGPVAGRALVEHREVGMISFTGSTEVGRDIAARAGQRLKKVTLELGGKSPNVVFADADLAAAADTSLFTFAVHQGQLCSAGTRLLVESAIHDDFVSELVGRAERLTIGDPLDETTQLGAVISTEQLLRIENYVALGRQAGAHVATGGARPDAAHTDNGLFYAPTIFTGVETKMRIAQEEIFGPVLSVMPFQDEDHAIELANDVIYGLAAGLWTTNLSRAHRLAGQIDAGLVYVNTMNVLAPGSPYSGYKESGLGVEGGFEQAESFTRQKSVWINLNASPPSL
jgi:acyl-CoA reductase-like NAD-dependent aldehyde dehydrogenase